MTDNNRTTVERTIHAPSVDIFEVLSNPQNHVALDGSGFVRSEEKTDRIQQVGDVFTMNMEGPHMGGEYQTDNHVIGYDENKLLAWKTAPAGTEPPGWQWVWEARLGGFRLHTRPAHLRLGRGHRRGPAREGRLPAGLRGPARGLPREAGRARDRQLIGYRAPMTATLEHVDVIVVGAGLSGIGAAHRLNTECPGRSVAVLEARDVMGGTWDLFRYPGVRSDSDMFTLGYEFKPWRAEKAIADGPTILSYIHETAAEFGIEEHDPLPHQGGGRRLVDRAGALDGAARDPEGPSTMTCGFLYSCSGYYDYDEGYDPAFPGIESFAGQVVHPQFWPEDLEYAGKRVVIIGSGATAVTLVPAMAGTAAHVTMLQRSPSWIGAIPGKDAIADKLRAELPPRLAHRIIRSKNITQQLALYTFCQRFPQRARKVLTDMNTQDPRRPRDGRRALHPDVRPLGPAVLRRARRRPVHLDQAR